MNQNIIDHKIVLACLHQLRNELGRPLNLQKDLDKITAEHLNLVNNLKQQITDYEEVLEDKRKLTRELDVLLNGENSAKQASLCDIVAQVRFEGIRSVSYKSKRKPTPVLNEDGTLMEFVFRNSGKRFYCRCGCNVFHKPDKTKLNLYKCNGCRLEYISE